MKRNGKILALFFLLISFNLAQSQTAFEDISFYARIAYPEPQNGVAFGDYDGDGKEDLYVTARDAENKLFRNIGDKIFEDNSVIAGVNNPFGGRTSIFFDANNDGLQDLYVGNYGAPDFLYLNKGDGSFENIASQAGISNWGWPLSVNVCDIDQDGDLDIYVSNSVMENVLYRNNGNLTFTDIIYASNATDPLISMGSIFFDYDNDGDQDLYLVHDSNQANILYNNNGAGYFTDVSEFAGVNYEGNGMGVDVGDIDNDGWLDIYVTNLFENVLFLNKGDGTFEDITAQTQVDDYGMGWGTNIFDFDNDGFLDIYVSNASNFSPYPNVLYQNKGDLVFIPLDNSDPVCSMQGSIGSAVADIDLDGRMDIAVANWGGDDYTELFHNQTSNAGNWIGFLLEGVETNRNAIGSRIELKDEFGKIYISEVTGGSSYCSQSTFIQHIGLGNAEQIIEMKVYWENGLVQDIDPPSIMNYYNLREGEEPVVFGGTVSNQKLLTDFQLSIYPNPASDHLNLEFEIQDAENLKIEIVDLQGKQLRLLSERYFASGTHQLSYDLNDCNMGMYFLKIESKSSLVFEKIMIK